MRGVDYCVDFWPLHAANDGAKLDKRRSGNEYSALSDELKSKASAAAEVETEAERYMPSTLESVEGALLQMSVLPAPATLFRSRAAANRAGVRLVRATKRCVKERIEEGGFNHIIN